MTQRASSSSPKFLWFAIGIVYLVLVAIGTLDPWPTASAKLAAIGTGPHIPVTYSSITSDTRSYRSQIYIVPSQIGRSWSTYRVSEENKVASLEEVRGGLVYVAVLVTLFVVVAAWSIRRSAVARRAQEAEA